MIIFIVKCLLTVVAIMLDTLNIGYKLIVGLLLWNNKYPDSAQYFNTRMLWKNITVIEKELREENE